MAKLVTEMIEHFIPLDADGSSEFQERVNKEYQVRSCLSLLIYKYKLSLTTRLSLCYRNSTHTRVTGSIPSQPKRPKSVCRKELLKNNIEFGVSDVIDWVERHGSIQGRFNFFETFGEL